MATLLIFFSTLLYTYISYSVDEQLEEGIIKQANYLFATFDDIEEAIKEQEQVLKDTLNIEVAIGYIPLEQPFSSTMFRYKEKDKHFLELRIPHRVLLLLNTRSYLSIKMDITQPKKIQAQVYNGIIMVNILSMGIIVVYAFFLSNMLISPIRLMTKKLAQMDGTTIETLKIGKLPTEFQPLARTLNRLFLRIANFIQYKKELFIGSAHELKTPLAVMKTKNQVTLLKKNQTIEGLREAIEQNIISIDEMNKIVSSILEFGRAEGAQLEAAEQIDVIAYLRKKSQEFAMLAKAQNKTFWYDLSPATFITHLQPLLLTQILQNFVQNGLKFTPEGKNVFLKSYLSGEDLVIEVIDEGEGITENKNLFAPFVRSTQSSGAGLGLFLAQSAAQALRATISLKNRDDAQGAIATLILHPEHLTQ